MFIKILKSFLFLIFLICAFYLLLPGPGEPPPLPESRKSTEPGDSGQIPGLFAYYTNLSREEVVNYYQQHFSDSSLSQIPLLTYKLNHPPEDTWVVIRDTEHTSFLEELVHPFRESWYINGYEPANDPFNKSGSKLADFEFDGKIYKMKVQVMKKDSSPVFRVLIFTASIIIFVWLAGQVKKTYVDLRHNR